MSRPSRDRYIELKKLENAINSFDISIDNYEERSKLIDQLRQCDEVKSGYFVLHEELDGCITLSNISMILPQQILDERALRREQQKIVADTKQSNLDIEIIKPIEITPIETSITPIEPIKKTIKKKQKKKSTQSTQSTQSNLDIDIEIIGDIDKILLKYEDTIIELGNDITNRKKKLNHRENQFYVDKFNTLCNKVVDEIDSLSTKSKFAIDDNLLLEIDNRLDIIAEYFQSKLDKQ